MHGQSNKSSLDTQHQRDLRRNLTDAERRMWTLLRSKQFDGHKFRRQHAFEDFILDFVCLDARLVIEVDGGQHAEQAKFDAVRTEKLASAGFRVLRFWNNEVLEQTQEVGERILGELRAIVESRGVAGETHPHPTLPLKGRDLTSAPHPTLTLKGREANRPPQTREGSTASTSSSAPFPHRPIRSYVLRQGRISVAQQRAYDTLLSRYAIPYRAQPLDFSATFGRDAPRILEIGFGMGETTAHIAREHPHIDYLAIEVHSPGVGSLLKLIDAERLDNIRIVQHDAVDIVEQMIAPDTLDGIHIFFPDPWPKKRHHKRRLIQPLFVHLLAMRLRSKGYLHLATDWQEYAEQMLAVSSAEPLLQNTADAFAERPAYRPATKFEQRGLRLGHGVWDVVFVKR